MQGYADPELESTLRMGPSGGSLVLVSTTAHVSSKLKNGFDRQAAKGANFGRKKFLGVAPATYSVQFVVLPEEEDAFWSDVLPMLRPRGRAGNAPPMQVVNPQINRTGVQTVTVLSADIDPPSPRTGRGVTIELEEWTRQPVEPKTNGTGVETSKNPQFLQPSAIQDRQKG